MNLFCTGLNWKIKGPYGKLPETNSQPQTPVDLYLNCGEGRKTIDVISYYDALKKWNIDGGVSIALLIAVCNTPKSPGLTIVIAGQLGK